MLQNLNYGFLLETKQPKNSSSSHFALLEDTINLGLCNAKNVWHFWRHRWTRAAANAFCVLRHAIASRTQVHRQGVQKFWSCWPKSIEDLLFCASKSTLIWNLFSAGLSPSMLGCSTLHCTVLSLILEIPRPNWASDEVNEMSHTYKIGFFHLHWLMKVRLFALITCLKLLKVSATILLSQLIFNE